MTCEITLISTAMIRCWNSSNCCSWNSFKCLFIVFPCIFGGWHVSCVIIFSNDWRRDFWRNRKKKKNLNQKNFILNSKKKAFDWTYARSPNNELFLWIQKAKLIGLTFPNHILIFKTASGEVCRIFSYWRWLRESP